MQLGLKGFFISIRKAVHTEPTQALTERTPAYEPVRTVVESKVADWPVNDTIKYTKETVGLAANIPRKYVVEEVKDKPNYLYMVTAPKGNYSYNYTPFTSMKATFEYKTAEERFEHVH